MTAEPTVTERLAAAATAVFEHAQQTRPELIAELRVLAESDPDGYRGMQVRLDHDRDTYVFSWVGTVLGEVDGLWVRGVVS